MIILVILHDMNSPETSFKFRAVLRCMHSSTSSYRRFAPTRPKSAAAMEFQERTCPKCSLFGYLVSNQSYHMSNRQN